MKRAPDQQKVPKTAKRRPDRFRKITDPEYEADKGPAGSIHKPDWLSAEEASALLDAIDAQPWSTALKRRVQQYGRRYDYSDRTLKSDVPPLPDFLRPLMERLVKEGHFKRLPEQIIVNEYTPGQGIAKHVDHEQHFGKTVASLSLAGPAIMHFHHCVSSRSKDLLLEPRSLIVLKGPARYEWYHSITPCSEEHDRPRNRMIKRAPRRVSITFRLLLSKKV